MKVTKNILAIAVIALALASCEEGPAGIFSQVADETSTTDNMTDAIEYATPKFVVRLGSTYYSGMGTLWQKADGASKWTQADTAGVSSEKLIAGSGGATSSALYVAFSTSEGDQGVWSFNGTSWTNVFRAPAGQHVKNVLVATDTVFITIATSSTASTDTVYYRIFSSVDSFASEIFGPSSDIAPPTSATNIGTTYILTAGTILLSGDGSTLSAVATNPTTDGYGGVCTNGTGYFASSRNGQIFYSTDLTSWTTHSGYTDGDDEYSLSVPTFIPTLNVLVVGTDDIYYASTTLPPTNGYLEMLTSDMAANENHELITNASNFESLSEYSITGMPLFNLGGGTYKIFAMTTGDGLWSNTIDTSLALEKRGQWVRE